MGIRRSGFAGAAAAAALAAALLLSGCAQGASGPGDHGEGEGSGSAAGAAPQPAEATPPQEALDALGLGISLDAGDARATIDALDALPVADRPSDLIASVRPDALVLQPATAQETVVPIDPSTFYLSIAPYRDATHPCEMHSLTTCLGELRDTEIALRVADAETGEVLVDGPARTADNGFVGVWLPSERELRVTVEAGGAAGEAVVGTGAADPTCLTTIRLS